MQYFNKKRQAGMSVIEIVVTVGVVSLSVLGLGQMINETTGEAAHSKAKAEAMALAERKIETLRDYATTTAYAANVVNSTAAETTVGTNATFSTTWTANTVADPSHKQVSVTVTWADKNGNQSVVLNSNIAEEEPVKAGLKLLAMANVGGPLPPPPVDPNDPYGEEDPTQEETGNETTPPDENQDPYPDGEVTEDGTQALRKFTYVLSGEVSVANGAAFNGVQVSGNYGGACTWGNSYYSCQLIDVLENDSWSGVLRVATNRVVCDTGSPITISDVAADTTHNLRIEKFASGC